FSPTSENFASLADPCDLPSPGSIIAANCLAAGVPATFNQAAVTACEGSNVPANQRRIGDPWVNCLARTSSTSFVQGGNPTLVEEKGKSLTLGVVVEPSFIPGLSLTVDYYKIEVENLIATLGAQQIVNLCYANASGLNNPFCGVVQRNPTTGLFVKPAVISGGINFAAQKTKGIDFDLAYRKTFENGDRLTARLIATKVLALDNYTDPTNPVVPNRQKSELGDPEYSASFSLNYDFGDFDIRYAARYIGK
ncbi:MAG: TonB-dependent receptor, partial [Sphingomonadaceae bacterium]|nr:TonB-dependent receptor [Sphingomonadaceae bacterium]